MTTCAKARPPVAKATHCERPGHCRNVSNARSWRDKSPAKYLWGRSEGGSLRLMTVYCGGPAVKRTVTVRRAPEVVR